MEGTQDTITKPTPQQSFTGAENLRKLEPVIPTPNATTDAKPIPEQKFTVTDAGREFFRPQPPEDKVVASQSPVDDLNPAEAGIPKPAVETAPTVTPPSHKNLGERLINGIVDYLKGRAGQI
jgi:hypothetical protein